MEIQNSSQEDEKNQVAANLFQGSMSRVLAREASVGQSSRIFYREAEGVPFRWEMQPGTPLHPQQEGDILPLSPPPSIQSLGLPLPNVDDLDDDEKDKGFSFKKSKIRGLKRIVKKGAVNLDGVIKKVEVLCKRRSGKERQDSRFGDSNDGELVDSGKGSSFSSYSLSSSFSFPSNGRVVDSSRLLRGSVDSPFCCSPWNVHAILDEGNTRIYYCSIHKTAFAVEEDDSFLSRILSRVSTTDQFSGPLTNDIASGVPFQWEMQPGTPIARPENALIPPPSPPPAVQSRALPLPRLHNEYHEEKYKGSKWTRAWSRIRPGPKTKKNDNYSSNEEFNASFRESSSVNSSSSIAPLSKGGGWSVSEIKRRLKGGGSYSSSCGPWIRRDVLVLAKMKLKSFKT